MNAGDIVYRLERAREEHHYEDCFKLTSGATHGAYGFLCHAEVMTCAAEEIKRLRAVNADEHYRKQWLDQVHHAAKLATALHAAICWHPDLMGDPYIAETVAEHRQRLGLPCP